MGPAVPARSEAPGLALPAVVLTVLSRDRLSSGYCSSCSKTNLIRGLTAGNGSSAGSGVEVEAHPGHYKGTACTSPVCGLHHSAWEPPSIFR